MPIKSIPNPPSLSEKIKSRRQELSLTIEEAAKRAGVGTKTWCRYEAGEAIRADKYKGLCKALNWPVTANADQTTNDSTSVPAEDYRNHKAWSNYLEGIFGYKAAMSFAVGSDILLDHIKQDLEELASMPKGTHLGQLSISFLCDDLPPQFLTDYDYDFVYHMKCALQLLRYRAKNSTQFLAHSVIEELLIYLSVEEAEFLADLEESKDIDEDDTESFNEWVFDLFDDADILTTLYSSLYLTTENIYHIDYWFKPQFYLEQD